MGPTTIRDGSGGGGPAPMAPDEAAVLVSGGLDSAILLAEESRDRGAVHPLYVRSGFSWEDVELSHLRRFLDSVRRPSLRPLRVLDLPLGDLLPDHWGITGRGVPDAGSPDESVFLPGRNALLLAKAILWCHLGRIPSLALATLRGNPFPDATPAFFSSYQDAMNLAIGGRVRVRRPYSALSKVEILRLGRDLPLSLTFSCLRPISGRHCGSCNKCEERRRAFAAAGIADPTPYPCAGRPG